MEDMREGGLGEKRSDSAAVGLIGVEGSGSVGRPRPKLGLLLCDEMETDWVERCEAFEGVTPAETDQG